jgi:hypothetical protein
MLPSNAAANYRDNSVRPRQPTGLEQSSRPGIGSLQISRRNGETDRVRRAVSEMALKRREKVPKSGTLGHCHGATNPNPTSLCGHSLPLRKLWTVPLDFELVIYSGSEGSAKRVCPRSSDIGRICDHKRECIVWSGRTSVNLGPQPDSQVGRSH